MHVTFNTSFFPSRRLLTLTFPFLLTCCWIGCPCDRTFPPFCLASVALRRSSPLSSSLSWFPSFVVWRWSSSFGGSRFHNRGILRPNLRTLFFSLFKPPQKRGFFARPVFFSCPVLFSLSLFFSLFFLPTRPLFSRPFPLRPNHGFLLSRPFCCGHSAGLFRPAPFSCGRSAGFLLRTLPRFLPGTYCAFFSAFLLLWRRPRVFTTRPFLFIFTSCLFS